MDGRRAGSVQGGTHRVIGDALIQRWLEKTKVVREVLKKNLDVYRTITQDNENVRVHE